MDEIKMELNMGVCQGQLDIYGYLLVAQLELNMAAVGFRFSARMSLGFGMT